MDNNAPPPAPCQGEDFRDIVKKRGLRRSTLADVQRRNSRSTMSMAIPFEDRIAAISCTNDSIDTRLRRLLNICTSSTIEILKNEIGDESSGELNDVFDDISSALIRDFPHKIPQERITKICEDIKGLDKVEDSHALVSVAVKTAMDRTKKYKEESDRWKQLYYAKRDEYLSARSKMNAVVKNGKGIGSDDLKDLNCKTYDTSEEEDIMKKVLQQEKRVAELIENTTLEWKKAKLDLERTVCSIEECNNTNADTSFTDFSQEKSEADDLARKLKEFVTEINK